MAFLNHLIVVSAVVGFGLFWSLWYQSEPHLCSLLCAPVPQSFIAIDQCTRLVDCLSFPLYLLFRSSFIVMNGGGGEEEEEVDDGQQVNDLVTLFFCSSIPILFEKAFLILSPLLLLQEYKLQE